MGKDPVLDEKHERIVAMFRVLAVVVGAILLLLGILGMLGVIVIDREGSLFLVVLGLLTMLTGILKIWFFDFLPW